MIRQTCFDRLRRWATVLEGRSVADRQHGWNGLWLSREDVAELVRALREAADHGDLPPPPPGGGSHVTPGDGPRRAPLGTSDEWADTQPVGLDEPPSTRLGAARSSLVPAARASSGAPLRRWLTPLHLR
jgi:hypothetical protein